MFFNLRIPLAFAYKYMIQEWIQMNLKRNAEIAKTFVKNIDSWEGVCVCRGGWGAWPFNSAHAII